MKRIRKCASCGVDPEFFQTTSGLFGIRCLTPNYCLSMSVPQPHEDWAIDNWNGLHLDTRILRRLLKSVKRRYNGQ